MILVIAEHDHQQVKVSTLNTITAAAQLKREVVLLVAGYQCGTVAESCARIDGVSRVIIADAECYAHHLPENLATLVAKIGADFHYILAPATTFGKNCLPRVAALLDVAQISEVVEIIDDTTFVRPIYAGNALATVRVNDPIKVLTIRTTAFAPVEFIDRSVTIEQNAMSFENNLSTFVEQELTLLSRPELGTAQIVVAGGRGMRSAEQFKLLETLADVLGAAIGASRAAVDAGFAPNDYQIGQTGKVVAPELYIAVGISGAVQHLAGMKSSKVIVAINKDADAPIFQVADYGLVGDLFEIVPLLIAQLKN